MASENGTPYEVSQTADVTKQIKELGKKAIKVGIKKQFVEALKTISHVANRADAMGRTGMASQEERLLRLPCHVQSAVRPLRGL